MKQKIIDQLNKYYRVKRFYVDYHWIVEKEYNIVFFMLKHNTSDTVNRYFIASKDEIDLKGQVLPLSLLKDIIEYVETITKVEEIEWK